MPDTLPEPWFSFLKELDELVTTTVRLDCIGGFVVTMLYGLGRTTADMDVLHITPRSAEPAFAQVAMQGGKLHLKHRVYLDHVTVVTHPDEYESRLREMFSGVFRHLRLMALDPYDLALTKLERNWDRDRSDVRHLAHTVPFDLNILRERYTTELRPYLLNPEREDKTLKFWIEDIEELRTRTSR
jgi:Nucleotidyltransferase of unknown function (DUF6036)